jgi:pantothenate kinase-related protein Tda10
MERDPKFILFKKLLIFGGKGSGKSTMSMILDKKEFNEEEPAVESQEGK